MFTPMLLLFDDDDDDVDDTCVHPCEVSTGRARSATERDDEEPSEDESATFDFVVVGDDDDGAEFEFDDGVAAVAAGAAGAAAGTRVREYPLLRRSGNGRGTRRLERRDCRNWVEGLDEGLVVWEKEAACIVVGFFPVR